MDAGEMGAGEGCARLRDVQTEPIAEKLPNNNNSIDQVNVHGTRPIIKTITKTRIAAVAMFRFQIDS